jgi:5'-AMP-activated protein kinase, catalytic alpha subunit
MQKIETLSLGRTIGSGTFGKVRRAVHLPTGRAVAVKILNKTKIHTRKDALRIER